MRFAASSIIVVALSGCRKQGGGNQPGPQPWNNSYVPSGEIRPSSYPGFGTGQTLRSGSLNSVIDPPRPAGFIAEEVLSVFLASYADNEGNELCDARRELKSHIAAALESASLRAASSASAAWDMVNGKRLLAFANNRSLRCQTSLIKLSIALSTNLPQASSAAPQFATDSGLVEFCNTNTRAIRQLVAGEAPWQYRSERRAGQAQLLTYAAQLPFFCPAVLDTPALKELMLHQNIARKRFTIPDNGARVYRLHVTRARAFSDSMNFFTGSAMNLFAQMPSVNFNGEMGIDAGGLRLDWYSTLSRLVFTAPSTDPAGGLFAPRSGTEYLAFNAAVRDSVAARNAYKAAGRLLAYSVVQRLPIGVPLPVMFFDKLLNNRVTLADVREDDAEMARNLQTVIDGGEDMLRMVLGLDDHERAPTMDAYIAEQLEELIPAAMDWRMAAVREGFNDAVPVDLVKNVVSPKDMRFFVYGDPTISVADLRAHTTYGYQLSAQSQEIVWMWAWLEASSNEVRRKFVRFVTGLSQLPLGGAGRLSQPIRVVRSQAGDLAPRSHTCFNQLDIPQYRSRAQLEEWMGASVSSDGFGMA